MAEALFVLSLQFPSPGTSPLWKFQSFVLLSQQAWSPTFSYWHGLQGLYISLSNSVAHWWPPLHSRCSWASQQEGVRSCHGFRAITLSPSLRFWSNNLSIPRKGLGLPFTVNSWGFVVPNMLKSTSKWCLLLASLKERGWQSAVLPLEQCHPLLEICGMYRVLCDNRWRVSVFNNKYEVRVWPYPRTLCGVHC